MKYIKKILKNNEVQNTGWIIGGKLAQMLLSFIVGLWSARYLGPSNYGLLNYISAYIAFFTSFCTLGITSSVMLNEFSKYPKEEGKTLGTTIVLRVFSSFISAIIVVFIVFIVDDADPIMMLLALFSSIGLLFNAFDVIEYWFLKQYMSKNVAIASFAGYCAAAGYKVVLLINQKSVTYFAMASSIDYIIIAVVLFIVYKKKHGPKLSFSFDRGKKILSVSYHFILSGMMVAIYGQTDKIMLRFILSEKEVGYYSIATSISTMWVFILSAIISSQSPTIVRLKKEGNKIEYCRKNRQLYGMIFYISLVVAVIVTILAPFIIEILYGESYYDSINPLRVIIWYVSFSYLGVARDIWLVCENKQKYSKYMYVMAIMINIEMNYVLIPKYGATGAAIASLITQMMTSIVLPLIWKDMRENVKLIIQGILCVDYIKK